MPGGEDREPGGGAGGRGQGPTCSEVADKRTACRGSDVHFNHVFQPLRVSAVTCFSRYVFQPLHVSAGTCRHRRGTYAKARAHAPTLPPPPPHPPPYPGTHTRQCAGRECCQACRASALTPHPAPLTPHPSPLTPHAAPRTAHRSPLAARRSPLGRRRMLPSTCSAPAAASLVDRVA